jgi:hypothetical protein
MIGDMKTQHLVVLILVVAFGVWLLNNPKCVGNCKKVAANITTQGIGGILAGLFAA